MVTRRPWRCSKCGHVHEKDAFIIRCQGCGRLRRFYSRRLKKIDKGPRKG